MKKKLYCGLLIAEAIFCILFQALHMNFSGSFSSIAAFPFEQIGMGIRVLSLSGVVGNLIAIVLYVTISLLPCLAYLILRKKEKACKIDWMLPALSILLLIVNYYMINPGLLKENVPGTGKWMLGSGVYAVLTGYLILRFVQKSASASVKKLQKNILLLLGCSNFVFVYAVFGQEFGKLVTAILEVQSANTGFGWEMGIESQMTDLGITYFVLAIQFFGNALPYLLDIVIIFFAIDMIRAFEVNRYSEQAMTATNRLADVCKKALVLTVIVQIAVNILQILFYKMLYQINLTITIPLLSILFVMVALLYAKYLKEDQKLKQENDLFV